MAKSTHEPQAKTSILLGFAYRQRGPKGRWQLRFRWGRIFGTIAFLAVCGYIAMSSAFYFYFKYHKNFDDANYWKMYTLLFRIKEHKMEMGEYQIQKAKTILEGKELDQKKFIRAYQNLRAGVIKSPANLEGRMMLADILIYLLDKPEMGMSVLKQGVKYAHQDPKFLKHLIQILLNFKEDQEVIELAEKILAKSEDDEINELLALGAATANHFRGNFDKAEDFIQSHKLDDELDGTLLSARISWDRGQKQTAISKLESSVGKFPNDEPLYAYLSRFHREMEDYETARRYAVLRNITSPLSVAPRIDLLYILKNTGEEERASRQAEEILEQFGTNESSLLSLANFAADSGQIDLVRRIYEQALEADFNIAPFALLLIEAHIAGKNFEGANAFTEELIKERPDWLDRYWAIFNSLRAVAFYGLGNKDLSNIYLDQFLKESNVRVESLLAVSRRFQDLGGKEESRAVLLQAYANNPENQAALSQLIELEIDLGNSADLGDYLQRLLKMRRPSMDLLEEAYRKLGSDRFIFTRERESLLIELRSLLYPEK